MYEVGNTVILTCVGYGSPYNPSVTWNREGERIDNTSTVRVYEEVIMVGGKQFVLSNLELCGISMDDAGLYSCSASLSSGLNVTSYFWVNVTDVERKLGRHFTISLIALPSSKRESHSQYVDV